MTAYNFTAVIENTKEVINLIENSIRSISYATWTPPDILVVYFDSPLSPSEESDLNGIISTYVYVAPLDGYSGYSGYSGTDGSRGISGFSGIDGISGFSGRGFSGFSGANGTRGISGFSGVSGIIDISEGINGTIGSAVLVSGTVVVNTTKVTNTCKIFLTTNIPGGTLGALYVSNKSEGTSFTITSLNVLDTSTVAWLIIEP